MQELFAIPAQAICLGAMLVEDSEAAKASAKARRKPGEVA